MTLSYVCPPAVASALVETGLGCRPSSLGRALSILDGHADEHHFPCGSIFHHIAIENGHTVVSFLSKHYCIERRSVHAVALATSARVANRRHQASISFHQVIQLRSLEHVSEFSAELTLLYGASGRPIASGPTTRAIGSRAVTNLRLGLTSRMLDSYVIGQGLRARGYVADPPWRFLFETQTLRIIVAHAPAAIRPGI